MKKLNLEEMEVVQGGEMAIACDQIFDIIIYLQESGNNEQANIVAFYWLGGLIQCN